MLRKRTLAGQNERAGASVELVIAVPVLLLLIMGVIQFALWQHANHVAQSAAEEGARSARIDGGTVASGQQETELFLSQLGGGLIVNPKVSVSRDATTARVEVTGTTEAVIPLLSLPVRGVSQGPVERFVPATEAD